MLHSHDFYPALFRIAKIWNQPAQDVHQQKDGKYNVLDMQSGILFIHKEIWNGICRNHDRPESNYVK